MSLHRHGLSIGIESVGDDFFLTFKATGTLTHADYERIVPMIDSALAGMSDAKIKAYIDLSELEGWEARAAWNDFKLGLKYRGEFEKIAVFGSHKWQEYAAKVASWFVSGEVEYFPSADAALQWLQQ
ncbi:hypothetical protein Tel_12365 [Candidatus Tenderia electrophaga]|jgi:hypothetical protein|uniref:STAS/SEC14 domain-containing protein n=1 Tax=Candidatus Tenderia electrophaga TaxID=1748243 RepID=A0A0S2TFE9_9GAMM|nr:hypothetical protein Tel_12365 [Candidatus Tenderia electrophaga]